MRIDSSRAERRARRSGSLRWCGGSGTSWPAAALFIACVLAAHVALTWGATSEKSAGDGPPGSIRFTAQNSLVTARGEFGSWRVTRATIDEERPERTVVEVVIDLASLETANGRRDEHLRSADFFDVTRYPTATVTLAGFRLEAPARVVADVTLDLHGRRRTFPMTFHVIDRPARRVKSNAALNRLDYGVGAPPRWFNPLSIAEEVQVEVEVTVPR